MGRPKIKIDLKEVEKLASYHCNMEEVADFYDVSVDTIKRRFAPLFRKSRAKRKLELRKWQWELAEQKHFGMLIWLGKQYLGQKDQVEEKIYEKSVQQHIVWKSSWGNKSEPSDSIDENADS